MYKSIASLKKKSRLSCSNDLPCIQIFSRFVAMSEETFPCPLEHADLGKLDSGNLLKEVSEKKFDTHPSTAFGG